MRVGEIVQWEKVTGEPMQIEDVRLTPQSRVLSVRFPSGGLVWNRPVSVIVERAGKREILRVPDVTLFTQLALGLSLLALPLSIFAMWKGAKR